MIILGSKLTGAPVMSLQTGGQIAATEHAVVDPKNLTVLGYVVSGPLVKGEVGTVLRMADIRELSDMGFIVDSIDELIHPEDIVKFNEVYELGFSLLGIAVVDEKAKRIGKVTDFTLETGGFVVQQLTVRRPFLHSFNDTELVIHRSQIMEITKDAIIVHSQAKVPEPSRGEISGSYINPFRKSSTAPESIKLDD